MKIGDTVMLMSGGPKMTISYMEVATGSWTFPGMKKGDVVWVECKWFDANDEIRKERFKPAELASVDP